VRPSAGHATSVRPGVLDGGMRHALVTGMSGTGKSTLVDDLAARGVRAVDLDDPRWSHHVPDDSPFAAHAGATDWRWRDDAVTDLLAGAGEPLVVSGTCTTQGAFYGWFAHVVLLSVPDDVAAHRLTTRTTNDHGKDADELARELALRAEVQPLLREGACLEVDTAALGRDEVADLVQRHLAGPPCREGARP
jgi:broad-specificity NMP kinase